MPSRIGRLRATPRDPSGRQRRKKDARLHGIFVQIKAIFVPLDVTISAFMEQTIATIARHRLPAIYSERVFVMSGGLVSYGTDRVEMYRRAASYVDRILRGEKAGDLPFQLPTKYDLVINVKTAKALGLTIPPNLLFTADEVIEARVHRPTRRHSGGVAARSARAAAW
jgi:ABC-type uncharacterized transport system substrate-binding protein